jgi:hypothetical protein
MKLLFYDELRDNILSLINNSREKIIIVSPFIKLEESREYISNLEEKSKLGIEIELHTRIKKKKKPFEYFNNVNNIRIYYQNNLHAKLYFNEIEAVVTSLNLIDYSIKNNIEIGFKTETENEYDNLIKNFYFPKLIYNDNNILFQHRLNFILKIINDKGKYFEILYIEHENEILIKHERYTIKVSGNNSLNYRIIFKEEKYYYKLKYFQYELRKYNYAFVYNNDNELNFEILFEKSSLFDNISESIISDAFYEIIDNIYHIKSTIAYLLYRKE